MTDTKDETTGTFPSQATEQPVRTVFVSTPSIATIEYIDDLERTNAMLYGLAIGLFISMVCLVAFATED